MISIIKCLCKVEAILTCYWKIIVLYWLVIITNHALIIMFFIIFYFFKDFIYLFVERGKGREKERERNINVWLPLAHPPLGTWPTAQACALDWESNRRPFNSQASTQPLSHTSQGYYYVFLNRKFLKCLVEPSYRRMVTDYYHGQSFFFPKHIKVLGKNTE